MKETFDFYRYVVVTAFYHCPLYTTKEDLIIRNMLMFKTYNEAYDYMVTELDNHYYGKVVCKKVDDYNGYAKKKVEGIEFEMCMKIQKYNMEMEISM